MDNWYWYDLFDAARFGAVIMLTFLVLAMSQRINKIANWWLSIFLLSIAMLLLGDALWAEEVFYDYPLFVIGLNLGLFLGIPAIYLAALSFVTPNRTFQYKDYWLFIPLMLSTVWGGLSYFLFSVEELYIRESSIMDLVDSIELLGFFIYAIIVWRLGQQKLKIHQEKIKLLRVDVEKVDLKWLYRLSWTMPILASLYVLFIFVNYGSIVYTFMDLILLFLIFYLGYYITFQQEIFPYKSKELLDVKNVLKQAIKSPKKVEKLLDDTEKLVLTKKLETLMMKEKIYLNNDISLPKLAAKLEVRSHQLSYLLNSHFNENFYAFINRYRIEESKIILKDPKQQHLNMLGVAYESGFNSKTTFNTTFKKLTGLTPTQYKKK